MAKTSGCALSGFVLVKKVPGALHFLAKSPGHSFDYQAMNMSHVVNYLYFGNRPSPRRAQAWNPLETLCIFFGCSTGDGPFGTVKCCSVSLGGQWSDSDF